MLHGAALTSDGISQPRQLPPKFRDVFRLAGAHAATLGAERQVAPPAACSIMDRPVTVGARLGLPLVHLMEKVG